ncbi:hypothetical protein HPB47_005588 [Ixodes persulcatus]|uniref:Uncharacterized protein n=1 Tax=Ixodes persulcatus TaxID=34615 RepID=A0AC60PCI1_IXOPE|nr:hypothetical protein HPB47_005588 [Ixodes persulcatus]
MRRTEFSSGGNPCPRRLFPFPFQEHVMNPRSSSCTLDGSIGASSAGFLLSGCSFSAGGHRGRAETDDDNERLLRGLCRLPHSSQLDRHRGKEEDPLGTERYQLPCSSPVRPSSAGLRRFHGRTHHPTSLNKSARPNRSGFGAEQGTQPLVKIAVFRVPIASALISFALTLPRSFPPCVSAAAKLGCCLSGLPGCGPQEYDGLGAGRREGGSRASRRTVSHASDPPDSALGWSAARCSYTLQETVFEALHEAFVV